MTLFAIVSSLIVSVFPEVTANLTILEFEEAQAHLTIPGVTPVSTHSAVSLIHCATFCGQDNSCQSFTINKDALNAGVSQVECNVLDTFVTSTAELVDSHLHYVQVVIPGSRLLTMPPTIPTSTTAAPPFTSTTTSAATTTTAPPIPTTSPLPVTSTSTVVAPTTTTGAPPGSPSASTIVDMIWGVHNFCHTTSHYDIILLTLDGTVYFYDDMNALTTGACATSTFAAVFPGYTSMPALTDIRGLVLHQSTVLEMYTDSDVWRWQAQSTGEFVKSSYTVQSIQSYLGVGLTTEMALKTDQLVFTAYRSRSSVERFFYYGLDQFVMKSEQWGVYTFSKNEDVFDQNGFNMNPWADIPMQTVALTRYATDNSEFILVDTYGGVYLYNVNHNINNNDPETSASPIGMLA